MEFQTLLAILSIPLAIFQIWVVINSKPCNLNHIRAING